MKQIKVYPLAQASNPPKMEFLDGSGQPIDTIHSDTITFFEMLSQLVNEEPADVFTPLERFYMQAVGIEKGKPFNPDAKTKALLSQAARTGAAMARANSFASHRRGHLLLSGWQMAICGGNTLYLAERWRVASGSSGLCLLHGAGQLSAMMAKNIGLGSYYLWTYKDGAGDFLDGAKNYKLHIPAKVPVKDFWSVLVYDSLSRSELQNGQKFPSVSLYSGPKINDDGSVDVYFGPEMPAGQEKNWIQTVPGKGWFPIFRFYGPLEPLFDKTWCCRTSKK